MASGAKIVADKTGGAGFRASLLLRPMPPRLFLPIALAVLIAGAFYCSGYEKLLSGRDNWPASLIWSAYGLLPWLVLFEYVKRREWDSDRALPSSTIAALLGGTAVASVLAEYVNHVLLLGRDAAPFSLQILRRTPGIGVMILLLMLSRREQAAARSRPAPSAGSAAAEMDRLVRDAPSIRWIQAADNYIELHLDGCIVTLRLTMREAAGLLEPLGFVRIHRSFMVNARHVAAIVPQPGGPAVRMDDGSVLPAGRAFAASLRRLG